MPPAARIGDAHVCPITIPLPHVGGPVMGPPPIGMVLIGGLPAAMMGTTCACMIGPPDMITLGCPFVLVNFRPMAFMGSMTAHAGMVTTGWPTVMVGDAVAGFASMLGAARMLVTGGGTKMVRNATAKSVARGIGRGLKSALKETAMMPLHSADEMFEVLNSWKFLVRTRGLGKGGKSGAAFTQVGMKKTLYADLGEAFRPSELPGSLKRKLDFERRKIWPDIDDIYDDDLPPGVTPEMMGRLRTPKGSKGENLDFVDSPEFNPLFTRDDLDQLKPLAAANRKRLSDRMSSFRGSVDSMPDEALEQMADRMRKSGVDLGDTPQEIRKSLDRASAKLERQMEHGDVDPGLILSRDSVADQDVLDILASTRPKSTPPHSLRPGEADFDKLVDDFKAAETGNEVAEHLPADPPKQQTEWERGVAPTDRERTWADNRRDSTDAFRDLEKQAGGTDVEADIVDGINAGKPDLPAGSRPDLDDAGKALEGTERPKSLREMADADGHGPEGGETGYLTGNTAAPVDPDIAIWEKKVDSLKEDLKLPGNEYSEKHGKTKPTKEDLEARLRDAEANLRKAQGTEIEQVSSLDDFKKLSDQELAKLDVTQFDLTPEEIAKLTREDRNRIAQLNQNIKEKLTFKTIDGKFSTQNKNGVGGFDYIVDPKSSAFDNQRIFNDLKTNLSPLTMTPEGKNILKNIQKQTLTLDTRAAKGAKPKLSWVKEDGKWKSVVTYDPATTRMEDLAPLLNSAARGHPPTVLERLGDLRVAQRLRQQDRELARKIRKYVDKDGNLRVDAPDAYRGIFQGAPEQIGLKNTYKGKELKDVMDKVGDKMGVKKLDPGIPDEGRVGGKTGYEGGNAAASEPTPWQRGDRSKNPDGYYEAPKTQVKIGKLRERGPFLPEGVSSDVAYWRNHFTKGQIKTDQLTKEQAQQVQEIGVYGLLLARTPEGRKAIRKMMSGEQITVKPGTGGANHVLWDGNNPTIVWNGGTAGDYGLMLRTIQRGPNGGPLKAADKAAAKKLGKEFDDLKKTMTKAARRNKTKQDGADRGFMESRMAQESGFVTKRDVDKAGAGWLEVGKKMDDLEKKLKKTQEDLAKHPSPRPATPSPPPAPQPPAPMPTPSEFQKAVETPPAPKTSEIANLEGQLNDAQLVARLDDREEAIAKWRKQDAEQGSTAGSTFSEAIQAAQEEIDSIEAELARRGITAEDARKGGRTGYEGTARDETPKPSPNPQPAPAPKPSPEPKPKPAPKPDPLPEPAPEPPASPTISRFPFRDGPSPKVWARSIEVDGSPAFATGLQDAMSMLEKTKDWKALEARLRNTDATIEEVGGQAKSGIEWVTDKMGAPKPVIAWNQATGTPEELASLLMKAKSTQPGLTKHALKAFANDKKLLSNLKGQLKALKKIGAKK